MKLKDSILKKEDNSKRKDDKAKMNKESNNKKKYIKETNKIKKKKKDLNVNPALTESKSSI